MTESEENQKNKEAITHTILKKNYIPGREINLYLDWQNTNTFIGKGVIIEKFNSLPIIEINDIYYKPMRCLCRITESETYEEGFKKHFIIPFVVDEDYGEYLVKKENKDLNLVKIPLEFNNLILRAISYNNTLVDNYEDILLAEKARKLYLNYIIRNKQIPEDIYVPFVHKFARNMIKRYKEIEERFDKSYPNKAKKINLKKNKESIKEIIEIDVDITKLIE